MNSARFWEGGKAGVGSEKLTKDPLAPCNLSIPARLLERLRGERRLGRAPRARRRGAGEVGRGAEQSREEWREGSREEWRESKPEEKG